jgi:F-BAR domain only protein
MKGNLASLAKDIDEAQKKTDKLQAKGSRTDTSKLSGAISGLQEAIAQWESQAPFVFESLQALDEDRVNHLRDTLTQLETHEVDVLERSRVTAGSALEMIININTSEEISTFVARSSEGIPSLASPRRPATATRQPSTPGPIPPTPDTATNLAPPASMDDRRSEVSSMSGGARPPPIPPSPGNGIFFSSSPTNEF